MFDSPLDFLSLLIAIIALSVARKAFNQMGILRARLEQIEASSAVAPRTMSGPMPLPLAPLQELEQTRATTSPGIAAEQPPASSEPITPAADETSRATAMPPPLPPPPPPLPASRSASAPAGWSGSVG
jgi:hypothetical protein